MRLEKHQSGRSGPQRYSNIPGVVYPSSSNQPKEGYCPTTGKPYTSPPRWGITTQEAADMLGSGASAARVMLKKNKIPFHLVALEGASPRHYWKKDRVAQLCKNRPPLVDKKAQMGQFLSMNDVVDRVGVGRSTIIRAIQEEKLPSVKVRLMTEQGPQKRCFFRLSDVRKWWNQRRARAKRRSEQEEDLSL